MTELLCLVYGLMCHHIRFMDVSALVFVLKLCKLFCKRCTQISGCLDCSLFSHPSVCTAVKMTRNNCKYRFHDGVTEECLGCW